VEVVPIRADGQDFGRLWLFHDTTARRRAEQQRQHLLDLEQQARRDAELQAERLQAYDRLRNEFVARVSHELRTPLTSIASASELLLSDDSAPEESVRQRLEIVRRNAERLRGMIEDLLLVGRLDAGMLTLERRRVGLPALVRDAVTQLSPGAEARDVALVVEAPADGLIEADPRRLREVVENLLGNAVKFTDPGTEVVVRVAPAGGGWVLSVRDHGPGIPPALRSHIFERFVRSTDADRRGTPGAGLGLAIVKGIVSLHGGSVSAYDAPGGGAVFECFLPSHVRPAGR
jgi:signal transduction histidine kinase